MNQTRLKSSIFLSLISMWCILCITGCKKLVQVGEPDDSLTTTAVFSNDSLAQAAVAGLYIKIMASPKLFLNGGISLYPALSADELQRPSLNLEDQFYINSISPNNSIVNSNLWKAAYAYIYQCNICIEGLKKSTGVSEALKKQLLGEVQFVRALCYHYLVNLFGNVPLALGTNADVNAMLSRSPVEQVYQQIAADLTAASEELTDDKPNTTPTKYAAQALLARVYLYMKQWSKAAGMASAVINSNHFSMVGDLNKVFKYDSKEIIFEWIPLGDRMNSAEGFIFVPASLNQKPNYWLSEDLLDAFEPGDLRRSKWVNSVTIGTTTYNYPFKYQVYTSPPPIREYNVVLRLAEQYLIRAEAYAQLNRIDSAVIDLNTIRIRAELPVFSTTISADTCLHKIERERRIELFAEWGHRWFDLKRTSRTNVVLSTKGSSWSTDDQLYPIPATELNFAPNLEQNPGYE